LILFFSTNLALLRQLQTQKSKFTTNFHVVEVEQLADLVEHEHLNKRVVDLITELGRIKKELAELNPKITLLNSKLKGSLHQLVQLYALVNSLDLNNNHILHQQKGLWKDLNASETSITEDRKEGDDL